MIDAQLQSAAGSRGARVISIQKYDADGKNLKDAAKRAATAARQADSILIADGADATPQVVQALAAAGIAPGSKQLIGTGLWDDQNLFRDPKMNGAWFAAPETTGYASFAQRYRARFGADPVRTASLAYDAVSLVAALVRPRPRAGFRSRRSPIRRAFPASTASSLSPRRHERARSRGDGNARWRLARNQRVPACVYRLRGVELKIKRKIRPRDRRQSNPAAESPRW